MSNSNRRPTPLIGAVCWLLGLEWFAGQAVAQAAWRTPFSLADYYVSDLGATTCGQVPDPTRDVCSPLHAVMNVSFILLGVLVLAGIVLLRRAWPRRRLTAVGLVFLALFGIGKGVVGLAPEDVRPFLHALGALGILCGNVGIILLGFATWRTDRWQAVVSLCIGVIGVVAFVAFVVMFVGPRQSGGTLERLADWPLPAWLAVLGVRLLTRATDRAGAQSQAAPG